MSENLGKKEIVVSQMVLPVVAKRAWAGPEGLSAPSLVCGLQFLLHSQHFALVTLLLCVCPLLCISQLCCVTWDCSSVCQPAREMYLLNLPPAVHNTDGGLRERFMKDKILASKHAYAAAEGVGRALVKNSNQIIFKQTHT